MWEKIFLFLLTIDTVKYRSTSMPLQCANRVSMCPLGKNAWTQKNALWKCAANYGYVCLKAYNGYLFESCMANFTIHANEGNCPILYACVNNEPYLGTENTYYSCPKEVPGCPPKDHAEYSIYQLYKYPKCFESDFPGGSGGPYISLKVFPIRNGSIFMTTESTDMVSRQGNEHYVIVIITSFFLFIFVAGPIGYIVYSRKEKHEYAKVRCGEKNNTFEEDHQDLRCWIQSINESEADRIQIFPLKEDDTIKVDKIYVPLSIVDEFVMHTSKTSDKQTTSELTPGKMFFIKPGKPARFIFLLGDAGYGKTVQCRKIAKSWCNAWKDRNAHQVNNIEVMKSEELNEWEKYLNYFEFLFYVPMRDVNDEHVSVKDMIYDYYRRFDILQEHLEHLDGILNVLKDKRYKCLIILDGLDEWTISESKREYLLNKGIPNCEGLLSCTFLITMRSWRFMEVESKCRQGLFDKILRLHGLDSTGFEKLTTNMLCNYFSLERNSKEFLEQYTNVRKKASSLPELESFKKIPLLAVFFILTCHERIETGLSLTTFCLSMIEALIKRSKIQLERKCSSTLVVSSIFKNFPHVSKRMPEISRLCKLAFEDLDSQGTTFILKDIHLEDPEVNKTVDLFLRMGLLIKHDASGQIHEDNVRFSFLHKTIQEFIYALYLVYDRSEADIVNSVMEKVSDIEKTLELATVLTFMSGLSPAVGCTVSSHIAKLTSTDGDICRYRENYPVETYYKVFHLNNLLLSCYREVRGGKSIGNFRGNEMKFILSDIILFGNDADRLTIRETADVLRYHTNDIKSLCMKYIHDDNQEGITNDELKTFLQESESLVSLNIDFYDRGKCRLLDDFNPRGQCLNTLGLHNVAFSDNILTDFLTKEESKEKVKALGLFCIKSADDLDVVYKYQFPTAYRLFQDRVNYLQKRKRLPVSENSSSKKNRHPLLKKILKVLPTYHCLSTLHVSYMESDEDRQMLLQVLPEIRTLEHFGYDGSSINEKSDDVYDTKVIEVLQKVETLRSIVLCQINLKQNILNFKMMPLLEDIRLYQFQVKKQSEWMNIAKSLSSIETLTKVVLCDTNIDEKAFEMLNKSPSSLRVLKIDSTEWYPNT